ncbi:hypothetical protein [Comamonas brasiliensis]|uniref:hypothetical protein n=1 Tax=Comamonas brasiliensis TaxID=1812482 RepID=UPI001B8BE7E9|nr:hypothetical protein [Comamonas sp. PE63]
MKKLLNVVQAPDIRPRCKAAIVPPAPVLHLRRWQHHRLQVGHDRVLCCHSGLKALPGKRRQLLFLIPTAEDKKGRLRGPGSVSLDHAFAGR